LKQRKHTILSIYKQLLEGVKFIHKFGIIHNDIKHLSAVVEKYEDEKGATQYKAYINDLGSGVECSLGEIKEMSLIARKYSNYFSSPENLAKLPSHFKSDVWSLGCLLYYMATQSLPWDHCTRS
jgi:serine/threonine protein kinase